MIASSALAADNDSSGIGRGRSVFSFAASCRVKPAARLRDRLGLALDRRADDDETAARAGDRAADEQDVVGFADLDDAEVLHRDALIAHVTGHAVVLVNAAGGGTAADGAVAAVGLRAVGGALAVEIVLLHRALETFALGDADDVDVLAGLEAGDRDRIALLDLFAVGGELADEALGRRAGLLEVAEFGLGDAMFLLVEDADLRRCSRRCRRS
jgi:hypothetical protein